MASSSKKKTSGGLKTAAEVAQERIDLIPKEIEPEIKYLPISDFRGLGFLQEINRQILHPCGLALVVTEDKIVGILDQTFDPEGVVFETVSPQKAWQVETLIKDGCKQRTPLLKFGIQPAYPKLTKDDIKVGVILRAKNPKYIKDRGLNDRVILHIEGNRVQYNSYEVPIGTQYPTIKIDAMLGWAKFIVEE